MPINKTTKDNSLLKYKQLENQHESKRTSTNNQAKLGNPLTQNCRNYRDPLEEGPKNEHRGQILPQQNFFSLFPTCLK